MPEQPRQDNDQSRKWMRQLERERLNALSIAEGNGLPGPGAVDAAANRPTPRSASDDPREWSRDLEQARLSMAMEPGGNLGGIADTGGHVSAEEIRRTFTNQELVNLAEILMPEETAAIRKQVLGTARAELTMSMPEQEAYESDDLPSAWKRQLDNDRGSMTALMGMNAYPGPGAAGGASTADAPGKSSMTEKFAGRVADAAMKSGLVEKINSLISKFQKVTTVIQTRIKIYASTLEFWYLLEIPPIAALHPHKLLKDGVIKSFAQDVRSLMQSPEFAKFKKLLGPLGAFFSSKPVTFILWLAEKFLMVEWALVIFLDLVLLAILLLIVVLLGTTYYCTQHPVECALEFSKEATLFYLGFQK